MKTVMAAVLLALGGPALLAAESDGPKVNWDGKGGPSFAVPKFHRKLDLAGTGSDSADEPAGKPVDNPYGALPQKFPRVFGDPDDGHYHLISAKCTDTESKGMEIPGSPNNIYTDDTSSPGCRNWEFNLTFDGDLTKNGNYYEMPLLDLNYGIGDNTQLKWEVPYARVQNADGSSANGFGNSLMGVKHRFYDNDKTGVSMSVYPQYGFHSKGRHPEQSGLADPGSFFILPVQIEKELGQNRFGTYGVVANVGYTYATADGVSSFGSASVSGGVPVAPRLALTAEVYHQQATTPNGDGLKLDSTMGDVGASLKLSDDYSLNGAIGTNLTHREDMVHTVYLISLQYRHGPINWRHKKLKPGE